MTAATRRAIHEGLTFRPVEPHELEMCAEVWRVSFNDYIGRLNQPLTDRHNAPVVRLFTHLRATDPNRFVAEMHKAGYATDPEYTVKLTGIMAKYDLYQYDLA